MSDEAKNESPDETDEAAQMRAILSSAPPVEHQEAPKTTPGEVKFAAALLITHGVCLAANSILWRDAAQGGALNPVDMLRGLLWLGFTIVLAGALLDRQAWAWWVATTLGGLVGVGNLLSTAGFFVARALGAIETVTFNVPAISIAALSILLSVTLLMLPSTKEVFGLKKTIL
jgi:hypothetical protein